MLIVYDGIAEATNLISTLLAAWDKVLAFQVFGLFVILLRTGRKVLFFALRMWSWSPRYLELITPLLSPSEVQWDFLSWLGMLLLKNKGDLVLLS